ncbi:hypothetical protein [Enterobacter kobei]|uniref:hypothetical protein n=1 Tax=Enterobacter kobei TaxID=208224 RepID=UPI0020033437|nr:hypothetical protein [Enterobacter kobei]MCK7322987.1 hypothetical protein [Enterobacter kobei]
MTFTKEQLQHIIETDHVQCGDASALARMALAGMEAEPVAWAHRLINKRNGVVHSWVYGSAEACPSEGDIFNIEVMPLYTAPPAPVALPSGYSDFEEIWSSSTHPLTQDDEMKDFAWDIWNACRAAMLQGADGNAPAHFRSRPAQSSLSPAQGGNSPVIPEGWVMVPEDPTHEMLEAGDEQFGTYDVYRRMIAASPQQEVKS